MDSLKNEIIKLIDEVPEEKLFELKIIIQKLVLNSVEGEGQKVGDRNEIKKSEQENIKKFDEALDYAFENYDKTFKGLKDRWSGKWK